MIKEVKLGDIDPDYIDYEINAYDEIVTKKEIIPMQENIKKSNQMFSYLGRMVSKENFRVFVYSENDQKLAENYEEFENLINSGKWFKTREEALKNTLKNKEVKVTVKPNKVKEQPEPSNEVINNGSNS